ncbi:MAG: transglycosylase family protein [Acidimicrobiales bacterium]
MATGLGLAALTATPDLSATSPAYAAGPTFHAAIAEPQLGSALSALASRSQLLTIAAPPVPVASASSALSAQLITPSPSSDPRGLPASVDRIEAVTPETALPRPRTANATTVPNNSGKTMEARWADLRHCEATSDYRAINDSGKYRGAYQFDQATWESVGGTGDPAMASAIEQDKRARILFERRGAAPWPECGRFLD